MDWQLVSNGISIISSLASTGSFLSSFSLDRDMKAIKNAVINIEKQHAEYNSFYKGTDKSNYLEDFILPFIDGEQSHKISSNDFLKFLESSHEHYKSSNDKLILTLSSLVSEIKNSYNFHSTQQQVNPNRIYNTLLNNPFDAGITQFWDISSINSYEQFPSKIISNGNSPILWNDRSGRRYLGEANNNFLKNNWGLNINIPHYKYNQDGYIYDAKSGLYLPQLIVV
jgi:hypothetical protein